MAILVLPHVIRRAPLGLAIKPAILLEGGVCVRIIQIHAGPHSGLVGNIEAIAKRVIRVTVKVAPKASLKANHILVVGFQIELIEWAIVPVVPLIYTTIGVDSLGNIVVFVDEKQMPLRGVVDHISDRGYRSSILSIGCHDIAIRPGSGGFQNKRSNLAGIMLKIDK